MSESRKNSATPDIMAQSNTNTETKETATGGFNTAMLQKAEVTFHTYIYNSFLISSYRSIEERVYRSAADLEILIAVGVMVKQRIRSHHLLCRT